MPQNQFANAAGKPDTRFQEISETLPERWCGEFLHFVQTGEAGTDFMTYLDTSKQAQDATEAAFQLQAAALEALAAEIKKGRKAPKAPGR